MIRQDFSDLIECAERIITTIERWGGADVLANPIDFVDEYLRKINARKDIIVQLDRIGNSQYRFKSLMTVDETALFLGTCRENVHRLIKTHGLVAYGTSPFRMLLVSEDLVQLSSQKKKGTKS